MTTAENDAELLRICGLAEPLQLRPLGPRLTMRWAIDPQSSRPVAQWMVERSYIQPLVPAAQTDDPDVYWSNAVLRDSPSREGDDVTYFGQREFVA
jgi:hypothetical protein